MTTRRRALVRRDVRGELLPALREPEPTDNVIYLNRRLPEAEADRGSFVVERRTPHRTPSMTSDVAVPFWQTLLSGLFAFLGAGLLAWALEWSWKVPVIFSALVLGITWLSRLRLVDELLWRIESATARDLNGDRRVGQPGGTLTLVNPGRARHEVAERVGVRDSEAGRAELLRFLGTCFTAGTSEVAHGAKSAAARARYLTHRDALLAMGVAKWRNPNAPSAGWRLAVDAETATEIVSRHTL